MDLKEFVRWLDGNGFNRTVGEGWEIYRREE